MRQTTDPPKDEPLRGEPREFGLPPPPARAPGPRPAARGPGGRRGPVPVPRRPVGSPEPGTAGAGAWVLACGEFVLLAFLAIVGAFFASANADPGDYACGMILVLAAIALAFLRLKARFDAASNGGT